MDQRSPTLLNTAPFTLAVMAICGVLYALMMQKTSSVPGGGGFGIDPEVLIGYGASYRPKVWDGEWYRFLAPMFLHANLLHIGVNMYSLYQLGPAAEIHFGSNRFAVIYLLGGLGGICLSQLLGSGFSVGASTSLFGILGAYLAVKVMACYDWRRALKNSDVRRIAFMIVLNLAIIGLAIPNVDNWGHIGGLIFGFLYGALFEYQRNHRRVGVAFLATCVVLTAGLVASCRWSVFSSHYYVHLGLKADEEGRVVEADAHFAEARKLARTFPSASAGEELRMRLAPMVERYQAGAGGRTDEVHLMQRYARLFLDVTSDGDRRLRGAMVTILELPSASSAEDPTSTRDDRPAR
jgi:membrane associated rhomboid family serine protease